MKKRYILSLLLTAACLITGCGNKDVVETAMQIAGQILEDDKEDTVEPEKTKSDADENNTSANVVVGIRPEFKEAMDSYEAFFDEYVTFMQSYADSDDTMGMLVEYTRYMTSFAETMEKMDAIDEEELSDVELAYYLEVTLRIEQKLLSVSTTS